MKQKHNLKDKENYTKNIKDECINKSINASKNAIQNTIYD